jgi:DNA polymerase alpha subunit B
LNDISFAVSSVDVLFHLRKEEFLKRGEEVESIPDDNGADSMGNLCRHLLQQRRLVVIVKLAFEGKLKRLP